MGGLLQVFQQSRVTFFFDRSDHGVGVGVLLVLNQSPTRSQIDNHQLNAGNVLQRLRDALNAMAAGHAADLKVGFHDVRVFTDSPMGEKANCPQITV